MERRLVKEAPTSSLPRERMKIYGAEALSDQELLAILLHTGQHPHSVVSIAGNLLKALDGLASLRRATLYKLEEIRGIGRVKAVEAKALIELGRRVQTDQGGAAPAIRTSHELVQQLVLETKDYKQEHLICTYLDTKNQMILKKTVFIGSLNQSVTHPREIFHYAIRYYAARIVLAHNHPFGNVIPSQQDVNFAKGVQKRGEVMDIIILDHLIVERKRYFSLREEGLVEER